MMGMLVIGMAIGVVLTCVVVLWLGSLCDDRNQGLGSKWSDD